MHRRPSPAVAIALLALFISLGGTTYAVTILPPDSVGSRQIRRAAVNEDELGANAVVTAKLADRAITRRKLALGTITGDRIARDALGGDQIDESALAAVPLARDASRAETAQRAAVADRVDEAAHAARSDHATGADRSAVADRATAADRADTADRAATADVADALAGTDTNTAPVSIADNDIGSFAAHCDAGLSPTGGGFELTGAPDFPAIIESFPDGDGWRVTLINYQTGDGLPITGRVYAICAKLDGA